jgi:hypothetical protein
MRFSDHRLPRRSGEIVGSITEVPATGGQGCIKLAGTARAGQCGQSGSQLSVTPRLWPVSHVSTPHPNPARHPRQPSLWSPIPPTLHPTVPRAPPEPHRSTLDPDRGYYGEAPVRPRWGYGGMSGPEGTLFWQVEAAKVLQLQQVRRETALTHGSIGNHAGVGTLRVGMVLNRSRDRNIPALDLWPALA